MNDILSGKLIPCGDKCVHCSIIANALDNSLMECEKNSNKKPSTFWCNNAINTDIPNTIIFTNGQYQYSLNGISQTHECSLESVITNMKLTHVWLISIGFKHPVFLNQSYSKHVDDSGINYRDHIHWWVAFNTKSDKDLFDNLYKTINGWKCNYRYRKKTPITPPKSNNLFSPEYTNKMQFNNGTLYDIATMHNNQFQYVYGKHNSGVYLDRYIWIQFSTPLLELTDKSESSSAADYIYIKKCTLRLSVRNDILQDNQLDSEKKYIPPNMRRK